MSQFKNINGRRYYKSLASMTKAYALRKAKEKRKHGLLATVKPDPDHRGYYAVYICSKKKFR